MALRPLAVAAQLRPARPRLACDLDRSESGETPRSLLSAPASVGLDVGGLQIAAAGRRIAELAGRPSCGPVSSLNFFLPITVWPKRRVAIFRRQGFGGQLLFQREQAGAQPLAPFSVPTAIAKSGPVALMRQ